MSQIAAGRNDRANGHARHALHEAAHEAARRRLDLSLVVPEPGFGAKTARVLWAIGAVAVLGTVLSAFATGGAGAAAEASATHALSAYHTGVLYCVGLAVGALGTVMILQQFNAGWSGAVRRQAEIMASLIWVVAILFMPVIILEVFVARGHARLFLWMNAEHTAGDPVYEGKAGFLNPAFWIVRTAAYFAIWTYFATRLYRLSRLQDETGDKWLTAKARFLSSFGLLVLSLTAAFASFDWLMSLDYHWFSTMFGVYFFIGGIVASTAMLCVILTTLRLSGRLGPTFTQEHQHDLGKVLFAFIVFWAYITFCQYFLIWYSNIPEETAFYTLRKQGAFNAFTYIICLGHFAVPFLYLLIRDFKRNAHALRLIAAWMLLMHAVDLFFIVRPIVKSVPLGEHAWVDLLGIAGPVCLFMGFVVQRMGSVPFIPIKDPRLHEILEHTNYV